MTKLNELAEITIDAIRDQFPDDPGYIQSQSHKLEQAPGGYFGTMKYWLNRDSEAQELIAKKLGVSVLDFEATCRVVLRCANL